jgi:hypothetical protein
MVTLLREVSPDLRVTIDDQIAEGDKIVTRWTASGTVQEEFRPADISSERVRASGIDIARVASGKIVETLQTLESHHDASPRLREEIRVRLTGDHGTLHQLNDSGSTELSICKIMPWVCHPEEPLDV